MHPSFSEGSCAVDASMMVAINNVGRVEVDTPRMSSDRMMRHELMSDLKCNKCGTIWDGASKAMCPYCLAQQWSSSPNMIKPKHDPAQLPSAYAGFRSTLPHDFRERSDEYYSAIAFGGTALYSNRHRGYCYVFGVTPDLNAGSAIPSGSAMPTQALDAYLVADPFGSNNHIFAEDNKIISVGVINGTLYPLSLCEAEGCDNLHGPDSKFCAKHADPPQAK